MEETKKQFTDDELKDHIYELKHIIRKLLYQPIEHTDHFRNKVSEEEKQKVVNEYIYEIIHNQMM